MKAIPPALFAVFRAEHAEHLEQIRSILSLGDQLGGEAGKAPLEEAFRRAHSLKGAARAVDLPQVEGLAHHLETLFSRVRDGSLALDGKAAEVVHQVLDSNEDCLAALDENREPEPPEAALRAIEQLLGIARGASGEATPARRSRTAEEEFHAPEKTVEMVRLPREELDRLVRSTGRVVMESRRQQLVTEDLQALARQIAATETAWGRLSPGRPVAPAAHGPAGRHSAAAERAEAAGLQQGLHALAGLARMARLRQTRSGWSLRRSAEQLQRDVWNARMAPAEDVYQSFRRMVRDLARDEGKEIQFQLQAAGVRADRSVLQALKDPVMHLLRNAISHGLEKPGERERGGKQPAGRLTLRLAVQRGRLLVEVDDDGRGVDFGKVARIAAERGLLPGEQHEPEELARMLFRPGFSTAAAVTDLSGRGMGLSVVHETVRRLQGGVEMQPKAGPGARVVVSVPLSIATLHLLLVACAGQTFGIPTHGIERLCRIALSHIENVEGKPVVAVDGRRVPLFSLARVLQPAGASSPFEGAVLPVMLLRSGTRTVALWVEQFAGEREALLQDLGIPGAAHRNVSGGAILGDGSVVVVLNPAGLVESCTPEAGGLALGSAPRAARAAAQNILVVDDSITTRSLEKSILETHGYRVRAAVDGVEALQLLRAEPADLIITDIQMPRLDGFGLLEAVKSDRSLDRIPVIIVSSLERPDEQRRGMQLGADAYVTKGRFDQGELLAAIRQLI